MIDIKTLLNSFRFIIIPKYQLLAAYITNSFLFRRIVYDMICCPAGKACAASGHTFYDVLIRNIHVDCIVNGLTHVAQSFCKALCLGNGPWKSVQYISVFAVLLMDAVQQHADGNFIRHKTACIHIGLGFHAQLRAVFNVGPENVPGRDMGNLIFCCNLFCLSALAGTRCA